MLVSCSLYVNSTIEEGADDGHKRQLEQGTISYREEGSGQPLVFVHGLLVDGRLWRDVTPPLAAGYRCIVPDWPLGSHRTALNPGTDRSPRGIAHLIADFLDALELAT